jgi:hypothetical protein
MFNKLKWIINVYVELQKKSYPLVRLGTKILIGTPLLVGGINIAAYVYLPDGKKLGLLEMTYGDISYIATILTVLTILVGFILIYIGVKKGLTQARKTAKVLIVPMLGSGVKFPDSILYESEKSDTRETIELGIKENETDYIQNSIEMFNAENKVDIYNRFILHHGCEKIFLGGRARIPFLVAYGSRFRNTSAKIVYFDQLHQNQKWALLDDVNEDISINYEDIESIEANGNGDIGLAISFTSQILDSQLPPSIKNHTLMISSSVEPTRNLIKNQENLQKISHEIKSIIDKLSAKENCKYIHMFLSVQTSLALEIGRNYQEGMHKNFIIHNFDADKGKYSWRIKICSNKIEII